MAPGKDQLTRQARLQDHQEQVLPPAHGVEAVPGPVLRLAPDGDMVAEPLLLAGLGPEALHHRIAADGVGQVGADLRVQGRRGQVGRADVVGRNHDVEDSEGHHQHGHENPRRRPLQADGDGQARQHDQGWRQHPQQGVRGAVIAPHGPADPPHRGAGEVRGVPVGGEGLHAAKRPRHHPRHDPRIVAVGHAEHEAAQTVEGQVQGRQAGPGDPGRTGRRGRRRHRVDQGAGRPGDRQVAGRRGQHQQRQQDEPPRLAHPVAGHEGDHLAVGQGAGTVVVLIFVNLRHLSRRSAMTAKDAAKARASATSWKMGSGWSFQRGSADTGEIP